MQLYLQKHVCTYAEMCKFPGTFFNPNIHIVRLEPRSGKETTGLTVVQGWLPTLKKLGFTTLLICTTIDRDVYRIDQGSISLAGVLLESVPDTYIPELYAREMLNHYPNLYIAMDGNTIAHQQLDPEIRRYITHTTGYTGEVQNLFPIMRSMKNADGHIAVSSMVTGGIPPHAFSSFNCFLPTITAADRAQLNYTEQQLFSSTGKNDIEHIGYVFSHKKFRLRNVMFVCRVADKDNLDKSAPHPTKIKIQACVDGKWVDFSTMIELDYNYNPTQIFKQMSLKFGSRLTPETDLVMSGARIQVLEWHHGYKPKMNNGFFRIRMEGIFEPDEHHDITLPLLPVPDESLVYAIPNPRRIANRHERSIMEQLVWYNMAKGCSCHKTEKVSTPDKLAPLDLTNKIDGDMLDRNDPTEAIEIRTKMIKSGKTKLKDIPNEVVQITLKVGKEVILLLPDRYVKFINVNQTEEQADCLGLRRDQSVKLYMDPLAKVVYYL